MIDFGWLLLAFCLGLFLGAIGGYIYGQLPRPGFDDE